MHHINNQDNPLQPCANSDSLLKSTGLSSEQLGLSEKAEKLFSFRAPKEFLERINKNDLNDPLLRQILPVSEESLPSEEFLKDPLEENESQPVPGVLHKYNGRALLIATGACAVHCRYCFRRHFSYSSSISSPANWQSALNFITSDSSLEEIILSGGDPLTLSDRRLSSIIEDIESIPHIKYLRIHSRIPIVLPSRIINSDLVWLRRNRLKIVLVVHVNHQNELNSFAKQAIFEFRNRNIPVFNQSVLLKGINDSSQVLIELSKKLFDLDIIPYYLHMLDRVEGTGHFEVSQENARKIIDEIRSNLPGYLVPRLVRESPGIKYKIPFELLDY